MPSKFEKDNDYVQAESSPSKFESSSDEDCDYAQRRAKHSLSSFMQDMPQEI